jgi:hypothetical protein
VPTEAESAPGIAVRNARKDDQTRGLGEHKAKLPLSTEAVRKLGERFRMAARSENFLDFSRSARR